MFICATVTPPYPAGQLPSRQSPDTLNRLSRALADAGFETILSTEFGVVVRGSARLFEKVLGVRLSSQRQFSAPVCSDVPVLRDISGRVEVSGLPVPLS